MEITLLEIYNEKIADLLAPQEVFLAVYEPN